MLTEILDARRAAQERLSPEVFDIIEGGIGDNRTSAANVSDMQQIGFRPQSLVDTSVISTDVAVLGTQVRAPLMLSPCAYLGLCDPEAEVAVARAAASCRLPYIYPMGGVAGLRPVVDAAADLVWFQIYLSRTTDETESRMRDARALGVDVLCVTVDTPRAPSTVGSQRNKLVTQIAAQADHVASGGIRDGSSSTIMQDLKPVTVTDISKIRDQWQGRLVVKGVMRPEPIETLISLGVDGVIVSNHGGRNLDAVVSSVSALPDVAAAAEKSNIEVFLDGGVRSGTDVLRAVALGARAAMIGRPYIYALAASGQKGVERLLEAFVLDIEYAMDFLGAPTVHDAKDIFIDKFGVNSNAVSA